MQLTSQKYIHNVRHSVLIGNHGETLVFDELHRLSEDPYAPGSPSEAQLFAHCFAHQAVHTFVPTPEARVGTRGDPQTVCQHPRAHAASAQTSRLSRTLPAVTRPRSHSWPGCRRRPASAAAGLPVWLLSELSTARLSPASATRSPAPRTDTPLSFACRPGTIWALVHWALIAFDSHVRKGLRPRSKAEKVVSGALESTPPSGAAPNRGQNARAGGKSSAAARGSGQSSARTPRAPKDASQDAAASASASVLGLPLVTEIMAPLRPFAYGVYADVYRCVPLGCADETLDRLWRQKHQEATFVMEDLDRSRAIVKAHRAPTEGSDSWANQEQSPPPLLLPDDWPSVEDEIAGIKDRTEAEIAMYEHLRPLQGTAVPRLYALVVPEMRPPSHAHKLLLERVGMPLLTVAGWYPETYLAWGQHIREKLFAAVQAVHALGVVHGDLHAGNIVVEWPGYSTELGEAPRPEDGESLRVSVIDWAQAWIETDASGPSFQDDLERADEALEDVHPGHMTMRTSFADGDIIA